MRCVNPGDATAPAKRDQVTSALTTMPLASTSASPPSPGAPASRPSSLPTPPAFANRSTPRSRDRPTSKNLRSAPESTLALRTDLELARQEIRRLRGERDELRRHLQGTLGQQLTNLSATPLVERIATLSQKLTHTRQANRDLTGEVTGLRDELDAARRALRQLITNTAAERTALTGKR